MSSEQHPLASRTTAMGTMDQATLNLAHEVDYSKLKDMFNL